jgi:hypothetical protein
VGINFQHPPNASSADFLIAIPGGGRDIPGMPRLS